MRANITAPMFALAATCATADGIFSERVDLPDGRVLVIAEAEREPRSVGSYSVRLYSGRNPKFPYDDFVAGIVEQRDGNIVAATLHEIDGEDGQELVIIMRSVGSGSYLSGDAWSLAGGSIDRVAHTEGLAPQSDVGSALREALSPAGN